jgi:hypothetical protein
MMAWPMQRHRSRLNSPTMTHPPLRTNSRRLGRAAKLSSAAAWLFFFSTAAPAQSTSYLSNLSVRSNAGSGSQTLIAGFVIGGSGSKAVLLRGDGPSLAQFGVPGVLPDPVLGLFNSSGAEIASNSMWGGSASLSGIFSLVGAFALPAGSKDAALYQPLAVGAYTAQISSTSGDTGVALVEVYDADQGAPTSRFTNLSARSEVGTGSQALIAGFNVAGGGGEAVLVRGVGPALGTFGVSGLLANPQLTIYDSSGKAVATSTGWGNAPVAGDSTVQAGLSSATAEMFTQLGAFPLPAGSPDCALVASLPPGAYTANVSGVNGTTGVALVEIYEVTGVVGGGGSPPAFISQPASQTIVPGGSYTFNVSVSGTAALQWYLNGNAIAGATGGTYLATLAGTYYVVATNAYGSATSNLAAITIGSGITSPVTDLAAAAGNTFYVTFAQNIFQALGLMQQGMGVEVDFSWDSAGVIDAASSGPGATGDTVTIKTNGTVGVGPGSTASGTPLQFEWDYTDSTGVLISIYFDGAYNPATLGQDVGSFTGLATILYTDSMGSEFADVGFVAAYSLAPPAATSF